MPILIFAQTIGDVEKKFETVFIAVAGAAYFILVAILKNATWLPSWLNTKLLSAIIGGIVALVSVLIAGLPPLGVGSIIALVGTLYNFISGWIDAGKKKAVAAPVRSTTEDKQTKITGG